MRFLALFIVTGVLLLSPSISAAELGWITSPREENGLTDPYALSFDTDFRIGDCTGQMLYLKPLASVDNILMNGWVASGVIVRNDVELLYWSDTSIPSNNMLCENGNYTLKLNLDTPETWEENTTYEAGIVIAVKGESSYDKSWSVIHYFLMSEPAPCYTCEAEFDYRPIGIAIIITAILGMVAIWRMKRKRD